MRVALLLTLTLGLWIGPDLGAGADRALAQPADTAQSPVSRTEASKPEDLAQSGTDKIDARAHRLAKAIEADILRVEPYLERYGYWAVFAAVGIEGLGIPAPGQTLLEAGALVAAVPDSRLNIGLLLLVTIVATSLGQAIGYLIGRFGGRVVLNRLPIPAQHLAGIERKFNTYGGWLLLFGRFVDGPRQLMGLFAGALQMHWLRFLLLNVAGAVLWSSFWALGVYYLDLHFDALVAVLRQLNPWMAALGLFGVIALLLALLIALLNRSGQGQAKT
ncbi:DedA family protein [Halochromatium roseum]|uniref:DedA family protein n=1 Tax=Halochromatium roseum TaxID=391920 RepID=UPI0019144756|nr:DedA family protein [Halochromatium roseum]MBK5938607.1 DedA family protein [Halochromatium roseum]